MKGDGEGAVVRLNCADRASAAWRMSGDLHGAPVLEPCVSSFPAGQVRTWRAAIRGRKGPFGRKESHRRAALTQLPTAKRRA